MSSSIQIVSEIVDMVLREENDKPVPEQPDEYDEVAPDEPKVKFGNGKGRRSNHFTVVRHYPKGVANDIQKKTRALHIAMCAGMGIEPDFKFVRKNTAAKLRGSKAYYEKNRVMQAIQDVRRSQFLEMENDITANRISLVTGCDPVRIKYRRAPVTDTPCAPLIPGSTFPHKNSLPRKTFRDVVVW